MTARLIAVATLLIAACGSAERGPAEPLSARVGWITDGCLAIANESIADGATVTIATLGDPAAFAEAQVTRRGSPQRRCPQQPAAGDIAPSLRFYELSSAVAVGIGVVGKATRVSGGIDINGDGRAEAFTKCAGSEGMNYGVWPGRAFVGEPLWSGYEYLGYDIEPDCPA